MPETDYKQFKSSLGNGSTSVEPPVYLLFGEEALYKKVLEDLLSVLLPQTSREFSYHPYDGTNDNLALALERLNTFSLLPGKTIVGFLDAKVFHSVKNEKAILEKVQDAIVRDDKVKASRLMASLLSMKGLRYEDPNTIDRLKTHTESPDDDKWLREVISYCIEKGVPIPEFKDQSQVLMEAIKSGFPKDHHLILTTELIDKRRKLYKAIGEAGLIVDCSVPKGDRRADKLEQEAALKGKMAEILAGSGKSMDSRAFQKACEMTGFNLRAFSANIEKLVNFVGSRDRITVDDVESVLRRTKQDPIFDFTNALTEKKLDQALFYMASLLSQQMHPLQIMAAMINQIRKLLMVKHFILDRKDSHWKPGLDYNRFRSQVMPAIEAFDREIAEKLSQTDRPESREPTGKKKKKAKANTDLLIAKNPRNPYPIYKLFLKSDMFTLAGLLEAMENLSEADLRLKSSAQPPVLVLENILFSICGST